MNKETRAAIRAYNARVAQLNGVESVAEKFTVTPTIQQKLESAIQESSAFLQAVNFMPVDELKGERIKLSIGSTIASRTDTTHADRVPFDPSQLDASQYECFKTDFDTAISYKTLDTWAKFPDFQTRIATGIVQQQGRDRLMIGWNGTSAAPNTNRTANPLLQDVNIGWLKKLELEAPARYLKQGGVANKVRVGANGDFRNLDELVLDMRSQLLEPWFRRDNGLTVLCSSDLLDEKFIPLVAVNAETPTETLALRNLLANKSVGGLGVVEVPFFPDRTLFITLIGGGGNSNLSLYYQIGSRRRTFIDNPKRDRYENYESANEAYVIQELGMACACINIVYPDADAEGGWS